MFCDYNKQGYPMGTIFDIKFMKNFPARCFATEHAIGAIG